VGAAASQVGPEALSLAAILNKELGIPLGKTTAVLDKAFGLTLTAGGLSQALARMGAKCGPTDKNLISQVRASTSVTMDEVWGGNRTENGAHVQEVLTSVLRTSRQRGGDSLANLAALLRSPKPYTLNFDSNHPARR
jgi:hypothetical protein